jgi:hypothetical protein
MIPTAPRRCWADDIELAAAKVVEEMYADDSADHGDAPAPPAPPEQLEAIRAEAETLLPEIDAGFRLEGDVTPPDDDDMAGVMEAAASTRAT